MLEIIVLFFLTRQIGQMADRRGLKPVMWKWKTVGYWILFEFLGLYFGLLLFGISKESIIGVMLLAITSAFGGYLLVRRKLERIPETEQ
jgi:hypothetical protein